jgi:hypothetical protein
MHTIINVAYYSWRNLVYYRRERSIDARFRNQIKGSKSKDIAALRRLAADAFLATVGLKTVDSDADCVPHYIPLSKAQKSWARLVMRDGYKVGLM